MSGQACMPRGEKSSRPGARPEPWGFFLKREKPQRGRERKKGKIPPSSSPLARPPAPCLPCGKFTAFKICLQIIGKRRYRTNQYLYRERQAKSFTLIENWIWRKMGNFFKDSVHAAQISQMNRGWSLSCRM